MRLTMSFNLNNEDERTEYETIYQSAPGKAFQIEQISKIINPANSKDLSKSELLDLISNVLLIPKKRVRNHEARI